MQERVDSTSKGTMGIGPQADSLEESSDSSSSDSPSPRSKQSVPKQSTSQKALSNRAFSLPKHEFSNNDIAVLIMGATGSGKSSFISRFTNDDVEIGHSLESCTAEVKIYTITNDHGRRLYLIDTPGFDDTQISDVALLLKIASALDTFYTINNIRFSGLIYMHRIIDQRVAGSSLKSLRIFEKICGVENFPYVVLVTSMWNILDSQDEHNLGRTREQMLKTKDEFFGGMIAGGAQVMRDSGDAKSAQAIIYHIQQERSRVVTALQREMADAGKTLGETSIGIFLRGEIERSRLRYDIDKNDIVEVLEDAVRDKDAELVSTISDQKRDIERRMEHTFVDEERLSVTRSTLADLRTEWCSNILTEAERKKREAQAMAQQVIELEEMLGHKETVHLREVDLIIKEAKGNEKAALRELSQRHHQEKQELLNQLSDQRAQSNMRQSELKMYKHIVPFITKVSEFVGRTIMSQPQRAQTFPTLPYSSATNELRMDSMQNVEDPRSRRKKKGKKPKQDRIRKHPSAGPENGSYVHEDSLNAFPTPEDDFTSPDYVSHINHTLDLPNSRRQSISALQGRSFPPASPQPSGYPQYPSHTAILGPFRNYEPPKQPRRVPPDNSRELYEDSYRKHSAYQKRDQR